MLNVELKLETLKAASVAVCWTASNLQEVSEVQKQFVLFLYAVMNGYHTFVPVAPAGQVAMAGEAKVVGTAFL
jgi:hypothetical protein